MPTENTATISSPTVEVSLGEHRLNVPAGGYYDRYRMQADLDVVAGDPGVPSVDFFRALPKRVVESPIGMTSTPNFYHAMRMAQIAMPAPIAAVRERLPDGLAPLQPAPGFGFPRDARITRGSGRLSDDLASLRSARPLRIDAMTSAQLALHMPVPTSVR